MTRPPTPAAGLLSTAMPGQFFACPKCSMPVPPEFVDCPHCRAEYHLPKQAQRDESAQVYATGVVLVAAAAAFMWALEIAMPLAGIVVGVVAAVALIDAIRFTGLLSRKAVRLSESETNPVRMAISPPHAMDVRGAVAESRSPANDATGGPDLTIDLTKIGPRRNPFAAATPVVQQAAITASGATSWPHAVSQQQ